MLRLRRFYNQNKKKIWAIIIIIAFAFALLRLANFWAKRNNQKNMQNSIDIQNGQNNNLGNTTGGSNLTQLDYNLQADVKTNEQNVIKQFTNYCNEKDLENAYNMITNECKEQMFNDIQTFENIYYNSAFENKHKEIIIENWAGHTYLVYFRENALALGKSTVNEQKGDYITVVKDDEDNYKLNINSYIGHKDINTTKEQNGIKIVVASRNTYMNYEKYKILVTNNSYNRIVLDTLVDADSIYIQDSNGVNYSSLTHELTTDLLTIDKGHTRELNIKFYSSYNSAREIKRLIFSDLRSEGKRTEFKIEL